MAREMIFNCTDYETRIAVLENGTVSDLHIERIDERSIAGNIYTGRVVRVLPGMQAAFVDIGLERTAFLHAADTHNELSPRVFLAAEDTEEEEYADYVEEALPIEEILTEGQVVLAQVSKEPLATKGARITTHISLPGRNLVLMPTLSHVGISRKIKDEEERKRLRDIIDALRVDDHGIIARTASESKGEKELGTDYEYLVRLWNSIQHKRETAGVPELVHKDLGVTLRTIRFLYTEDMERMVIDSPQEYRKIKEFMAAFMPDVRYRLDLYERPEPIFDHFGIEPDIEKILRKKVWLKSGGYIVIEQTEALCSIDVNTGKYVGKRDLEDTILKINLEAVKEIAYQLRVRNIGGLIIIDLIDMEIEENRETVYNALVAELEKDRSKTSIQKISELGLVEMTRQRRGKSLHETMCETCPYCSGRGSIKSKTTICFEIFRALERESRTGSPKTISVLAHPDITAMLLEHERGVTEKLEKKLNAKILIQAEKDCHLEYFEIIPMH